MNKKNGNIMWIIYCNGFNRLILKSHSFTASSNSTFKTLSNISQLITFFIIDHMNVIFIINYSWYLVKYHFWFQIIQDTLFFIFHLILSLICRNIPLFLILLIILFWYFCRNFRYFFSSQPQEIFIGLKFASCF